MDKINKYRWFNSIEFRLTLIICIVLIIFNSALISSFIIVQNEKTLGILDIATSSEQFNTHNKVLIRKAIIFSFFSIIGISLFIFFFLQSLVGRPVKNLIDNAQKLSETQEHLFHAQKLASLGKLAASVAHEINNPLTVILNNSSLLLQDCALDSANRQDVEMIVNEAKRCRGIIRNLLDFTRVEKPEMVMVNINKLIDETLMIVQHQASLDEINIITEFSTDIPKIKIDPNQIKQVFIDIIMNAIYAMPRGGKLAIKTYLNENKEMVAISFSDTGIGIPKEFHEKIFMPFFTTKDATQGLGLGLAICHEIIEKHQGRITFHSNVDIGTTFKIELPITK